MIFGKGKKDFFMFMSYVVFDCYFCNGGCFVFVIMNSVFFNLGVVCGFCGF